MSNYSRKTVKIYSETYKHLERISKETDKPILHVVSTIVNTFVENEFVKDFNLEAKTKPINYRDLLTNSLNEQKKELANFMKERTNTIIGFIKTLDKKVEGARRDIIFKVDPDDDTIFHPLEFHYDFVIKNLLLLLEVNGMSTDDCIKNLEVLLSRDEYEFFIKSYNAVMSKRIN
ncbi:MULTISPECIES: hypothetical protein [Myroides]|uniref:hypothetical protein n=1 Tax=Myroides TaxID=76831 RepID=UPI0015F90DD3|nr:MULTISPECIES: hypothetical protein [Myroides]MBB1138244.1 hypothetical protein [Myroides sp. WP-1]MDM1037223.1 hypothetical protein [Myroides odoratimimus]MDM1051300.1 hypothetical protein [Myroides odoratimimus]MDM1083946.1 hypothetical protein [Myroides odoratimimus]MDM1098277.1 hypothetical protein [Myroides odoratimimus]